jgi:hypothetical protein
VRRPADWGRITSVALGTWAGLGPIATLGLGRHWQGCFPFRCASEAPDARLKRCGGLAMTDEILSGESPLRLTIASTIAWLRVQSLAVT